MDGAGTLKVDLLDAEGLDLELAILNGKADSEEL